MHRGLDTVRRYSIRDKYRGRDKNACEIRHFLSKINQSDAHSFRDST